MCNTFKNCEGLSQVAFMDGNGMVMSGKVIPCMREGKLPAAASGMNAVSGLSEPAAPTAAAAAQSAND